MEAERLRAALMSIFVATPEIRATLRKLTEYLRAQFEIVFSDDKAYLSGIYQNDPWKAFEFPAVCITGLAGVGKTAIREAFFRLIGPAVARTIDGHEGLRIVPAWDVSLRNGTSWSAMLSPVLDRPVGPDGANAWERSRAETVLRAARRQSWRDSTCAIWADEFQKVSFSAQANAKATAILVGLLGIGPRIFFTANFSLVNALLKRNQQDIQRFLSLPIVLNPEPARGDNLPNLLLAYRVAAPGVFACDLEEAAPAVHQFTYGVKRNIVSLLVHAYRIALEEGRKQVVLADLESAFVCPELRAQREEVALLFEQGAARAKRREDLWCALATTVDDRLRNAAGNPQNAVNSIDGSPGYRGNLVELSESIEQFTSRVEHKLLLDMLRPEVAEAVREVEDSDRPNNPRKRASVVAIPRRRATKADLLNGLSAYSDPK